MFVTYCLIQFLQLSRSRLCCSVPPYVGFSNCWSKFPIPLAHLVDIGSYRATYHKLHVPTFLLREVGCTGPKPIVKPERLRNVFSFMRLVVFYMFQHLVAFEMYSTCFSTHLNIWEVRFGPPCLRVGQTSRERFFVCRYHLEFYLASLLPSEEVIYSSTFIALRIYIYL